MKDLNKPLLRFHQREQLNNDISQAETMLAHAKPDDRATIKANIDRSKRQLHEQSPEPLTGKEKDTLNTLEKKLLTRIRTNMPTDEVMRKNPAGAVDWHQKWERANKKLIRMWKNVKVQLNPDSADRDLSNIERFRPVGQMDRLRSDAQIPGVISYSNVREEDWPFEAPQNTALAQAQRRYEAEQAESEVNTAINQLDADEAKEKTQEANEEADGRKKETSPEQHAILVARLATARAALKKKREEEQQVDEALSADEVKVD